MEFMNTLQIHILNLLANDNGGDKINEFIKNQIGSWFGSIATLVSIIMGLGVTLYCAQFWVGYAFADEDGKEEKMVKWKKSLKGIIGCAIGGVGAATIGGPLLAVFGIPTSS